MYSTGLPAHSRAARHAPAAHVRSGLAASLLALGTVAWASTALAGPSQATGADSSATVTGLSPVTLNFPLSRTGDNGYDTWIQYATQDGTAKAGADYTAASGAVKVPAGGTTASIPVQILGASQYTTDKQFTVKLLGAAGVGPTPAFAAQQTFTVGDGPRGAAMADLNGDGQPDLATADYRGGAVSVLLNTTSPGAATPSLAAHQSFFVGGSPHRVSAADLNGDGKRDLIVSNATSSVSVLLNTTATGATVPSFAGKQAFATGVHSFTSTTADVNRDGKPDLIATNADDNTVSVLLNTTTPGAATLSFATQKPFSVGAYPYPVTTTDVNGDGRPDILVANSQADTVSVLLNTTTPGTATPRFATQRAFAVGHSANSLAAADLNGDGKPDLVAANLSADTVSVLLNTTAPGAATPNFAPQETFSVGIGPTMVKAVDINGDGKADLVTANSDDNTASVLLNTTAPGAATPSFAPGHSFAVGADPRAVVAADVNSDGETDLIAANYGTTTASVLLNTTVAPTASAPSFTSNHTFGAGRAPSDVQAADLNGDGRSDVLAVTAGRVTALLNRTAPGAAAPSLASAQSFAACTNTCLSVTAFDANGDGRPDAMAADRDGDSVVILRNKTLPGATTPDFAPQQTFLVGTSPYAATEADFNGDGRPDVVAANRSAGTLSVLLNNTAPGSSTLSFHTQATFATGFEPYWVTTADFNGDGKSDLVSADGGDNTVSVLLNTTAPGATTPSFATRTAFAVSSWPFMVKTLDVNADGKPDLATANYSSNTVSVLLNTTTPGASTPTFTAQRAFAVGSHPQRIAVSDVNADGRLDILAVDSDSDTISVLLNTTAPSSGTATFAPEQTLATGTFPSGVATADINGDGSPDLLSTDFYDNDVSVRLNTQFAASVSPASVTGTIQYVIPRPSLSPGPLGLGDVLIGTDTTKTETLSNTGGASLAISGIAISGTDSAFFSLTNNCPASLAAGSSCAIQVAYTPNALASNSATLTISSDAPSSPDTVALSGIGIDTAPTARAGSISTSVDTAVTGHLSATDSDVGQTLSYAIVTPPRHGTVNVNASTGAYTYTPTSGYAGPDRFTFKVNDGYRDSNAATEQVVVDPGPPATRGGGGAFGPWELLGLGLLAALSSMARRRKRATRAGLVTSPWAVVLMLPLLAAGIPNTHAASPAKPWYALAQANAIRADGARHADNNGLRGWGLGLGHKLDSRWALEVAAAYHKDYPRTRHGMSNWTTYGLAALWYPLTHERAYAPFVTLGLGRMYEYRGDDSELHSSYSEIGAGLTARPWPFPVSVRADARLQHAYRGGYNDAVYSIGVVIPFGL